MAAKMSLPRFRRILAEFLYMMETYEFPPTIYTADDHRIITNELKKYRRWCGIIDAMTDVERENPTMLSCNSRNKRIARGSGCSNGEVQTFLAMFESESAKLMIYPVASSTGIEFDRSLCQRTHNKMVAGVCPWCGQEILTKKQFR